MEHSLTIVAVTGAQSYAQNSVYAIQRSYFELQKKIPVQKLRCLLVSPEKPEVFFDNIQHLPCKPFGYLEYSLFMVYSLAQFIETSHVLIVQDDGWVLNGNNWQDVFFNYDYIGSPLPIFVDPNGHTYRDEFWYVHNGNPPEGMIGHQNGVSLCVVKNYWKQQENINSVLMSVHQNIFKHCRLNLNGRKPHISTMKIFTS